MGEPILNLSAWIDRRRKEVGPYADHIVHSVKAYEARIAALEEERDRLREALEMVAAQIHSGDDMPDDTWADFTGAQTDQIFSALSRAALEGE